MLSDTASRRYIFEVLPHSRQYMSNYGTFYHAIIADGVETDREKICDAVMDHPRPYIYTCPLLNDSEDESLSCCGFLSSVATGCVFLLVALGRR